MGDLFRKGFHRSGENIPISFHEMEKLIFRFLKEITPKDSSPPLFYIFNVTPSDVTETIEPYTDRYHIENDSERYSLNWERRNHFRCNRSRSRET